MFKKRGAPIGPRPTYIPPTKSFLMSCAPAKTLFYDDKQAGEYIGGVLSAPMSKPRNFMLSMLSGKKLTPQQAIKAKCFDCCGFFVDGRNDCGIKHCPLYNWMPYGRKEHVK
jgi:hypothetical protein